MRTLRSSSNKKSKRTTKSNKLNIKKYLAKLEKVKERVVCSPQEIETLNANDITKKHYKRCTKIVQRFIDGLKMIGKHFLFYLFDRKNFLNYFLYFIS